MERNEILTKVWEASESGALIPSCAWCGRVRIDGEWVDPPGRSLATIDQPMMLSHSICPTCFETPWPPLKDRRDVQSDLS